MSVRPEESLPKYTATPSQKTSLHFFKNKALTNKPDHITIFAKDRKTILYEFDCEYISNSNSDLTGILEKENQNLYKIEENSIYEFNLNLLKEVKNVKKNKVLNLNNKSKTYFFFNENDQNKFYWTKFLDYKNRETWFFKIYNKFTQEKRILCKFHPFSLENGRQEQGRLDIQPEAFEMIDFIVATFFTTGAIKKRSPEDEQLILF
ncbi:hypothetical protein HK099_004108 [Clydaea vesicula]|uniref:DUF6593 domain-containing protein n=1 Tax=Clydaea vesicula TaxID=447962 RepID=A0AAD5XZU1_9FUNG|nr:hypothetical protein HK099_004108 [Clydaea vesicula]KAJ3397698.1 hypothetical protein HDU92_004114 [Lobulomyces angularis]